MDGLKAGSLWQRAASAPPRAEGAGGRVGGSHGAPVQLRAWWGAVACVSHQVRERVVLEHGTVQAFQNTSLSAGSAGDMGPGSPLPLSPAPRRRPPWRRGLPSILSSVVRWCCGFLRLPVQTSKPSSLLSLGERPQPPRGQPVGVCHLHVSLCAGQAGLSCHGEPEGRFHGLFSRGKEPCG